MARSSIPPGAVGAPLWWPNLTLNDKGGPRAILLNGDVALSQDPAFTGAIRFDRFRNQTMVCAPLPWDPHTQIPRPWENKDDYEACLWLQHEGIMLNDDKVNTMVEGIAQRYPYHPVMDYLHSVTWNGVVPQPWLTHYLKVEDTPYSRTVGEKFLISAVARIFKPGCKADCALVLEGKQGIGKSSTFSILGGSWYTNDIAALGTKDSQEQVVGAWIIELDELDAVRKSSDWASVLSFVSRSSDRFRFFYARRVLPYPRQCVFGATTNSATYIRGESGDRRFWPVKCGPSIDLDALARDRDQIWAYHVHLYFAGVKWHVNETQDPAFVADHAEQIKERREIDPWTDDVLDFVDNSFNYMKDFLSTTEILKNCIKMPPDRMSKMDTMRIASILTLAGWTRKSVRVTDVSGKSKPKWAYVRPTLTRT